MERGTIVEQIGSRPDKRLPLYSRRTSLESVRSDRRNDQRWTLYDYLIPLYRTAELLRQFAHQAMYCFLKRSAERISFTNTWRQNLKKV